VLRRSQYTIATILTCYGDLFGTLLKCCHLTVEEVNIMSVCTRTVCHDNHIILSTLFEHAVMIMSAYCLIIITTLVTISWHNVDS
jgi:hypothetical protein